MDDQERMRLKFVYRKMCEDAGYPKGVGPTPWNISTRLQAHEEALQEAADNNTPMEAT